MWRDIWISCFFTVFSPSSTMDELDSMSYSRIVFSSMNANFLLWGLTEWQRNSVSLATRSPCLTVITKWHSDTLSRTLQREYTECEAAPSIRFLLLSVPLTLSARNSPEWTCAFCCWRERTRPTTRNTRQRM